MIPKQITNDQCLICQYPISNMAWTDYNGQVWCPRCGLTYQILDCKLKDEYLQSIGKTKDDVKVPYCDIEEMIPLIQKYYQLKGKSSGQGCYMSSRQDYRRDGDRSGNVYPLQARKEFEIWVIKNNEELEKEFPNCGVDWAKVKEIKPNWS